MTAPRRSDEVVALALACLDTVDDHLDDPHTALAAVRNLLETPHPRELRRVAAFLALAALRGRDDPAGFLAKLHEGHRQAREVDELETLLWSS